MKKKLFVVSFILFSCQNSNRSHKSPSIKDEPQGRFYNGAFFQYYDPPVHHNIKFTYPGKSSDSLKTK